MARFHGIIGYGNTVNNVPGVWTEEITERCYTGDVSKIARSLISGEHLNDNINISNSVSIVADAYAYQNFSAIRYVEWMGTKWKVTNVEVARPRLILTLGGIYNGEET